MTSKEVIEEFRKEFTCDCDEFLHISSTGDEVEEIEDFILKVRRDAVEEAFKAIEIEKEDNESVSEFYSGYNLSVKKIEQKKKEFLENL